MGVVYDDPMIYHIPEANIGQFEKRIARLIKRAAKLKANLSYTIDRNDFEDRKFEFEGRDGKKVEKWVRYIKVTVDGDRPQIPGWSFIGTLEHTDEGNVLRMVPGETAPEKYRDTAPVCEHCKLKRTRRDTFLVRSEAGIVSQVGSNCLVDFLGHENPHQLAQLSTVWINIDDLTKLAEDPKWVGGYGGGLSIERHDLLGFLSFVAELTIRYGFFSKSQVARLRELRGPDAKVPEATSARACRMMFPNSDDWSEAAEHAPTPEAVKMAEDAREWALQEFGMAMPDGSDVDDIKAAVSGAAGRELTDFEHNLFVVAKGESVERRTFGIAAYIIQAYRKANDLIPSKATAPTVPSKHFGTIGERFMKLKVTCEKIHFWTSEFHGQGCLQKMRTADGNVVVWRTYNVSDANLMEEGQEFAINATVKQHGEFNGEKQTEVSRLKIVSRPQQPPVAPTDDKPLIETSLTIQAQPENAEPGDDFVPTGLQMVAA
jgi:hypothetical protein